MDPYTEFLASKVKLAPQRGLKIEAGSVNPKLMAHQRLMVQWMVEGGCRALFAAFGLGKSVVQLETLRLILEQTGGRALIVAPLGVRQEFARDAVEILGWAQPPKFIRRIEEAGETGIYLTNYETVRDGKLDPRHFIAASLDEASVLRGFGGSKTFREFMRIFTGDAGPAAKMRGVVAGGTVTYRFVATATPSPNEYIELLAYADFLGIMDASQAKTRFFKRDSTKADKLTIHPHKEAEFWLWVASWALFVQKPSDLGCDDAGYDLPALEVRWHEVSTDHSGAGYDRSGQGKMFRDSAIGVQDAASEKRRSLTGRIAKLMEIRAEEPGEHRVLWHDLEAEREALEAAIPGLVTVRGGDTDEHKEESILGFSDGLIPEIGGKPCMLGAGVNWQRHCARMVFLGIGFKFNDFIQAIHRVRRFLQKRPVRVDIIFTEAERGVRKQLERKWQQHNQMVATMSKIIQEFGLSQAAMAHSLTRKMGIAEPLHVKGERFHITNNDSILETRAMAANSVGLIVTSIPFSSQYEYSPNFADLGHSEGNNEFFQQMDFLTPELLRVLQPGRICAIHVKDRIVPGGMTGLGFQVVYPFHCETIAHFTKHGFAYMGMKTVVTDVVRENNQTYRLGWSEQCKDGTKMGVGMPEYLLIFRKPPTSAEKSYADVPVVKPKPRVRAEDGTLVPWGFGLEVDEHGETPKEKRQPLIGDGYSRGRWQVDAHGFTRSGGERLIRSEEFRRLSHKQIFRLFRQHSLHEIYNHEHHVLISEQLDEIGRLPVTFMLLQPQSWSPEVWTDITRMLTLNTAQSGKGKEKHLCPLQFDLVDRAIEQWSNPGEAVYDPFNGIGTVAYRAILKKRFGRGCELSTPYFLDSVSYCRAAEAAVTMPSLFDLDQFTEPPGEEEAPVPEELEEVPA